MNKFVNAIQRSFKSKGARFDYLTVLGFYNWISDKNFLKKKFKIVFGHELNLDVPQTFSEKIQWLKLYDRRPEYTMMVDKYLVRNYIAKVLGEEYLVPLLGVWNDPDEIDFDKLPNQFVLKCNHNSGRGMCICKDKTKLDIKRTKNCLREGLRQNYFFIGREWPYKNVAPKIVAEQFLADDIIDYKFYCFNGVADSVLVCLERETGFPKYYYFDKEWKLKRFNIMGKEAALDFTLPKPGSINKMFQIAEKLSKGIPFVRVDLYCISDKIYFGEMTFYPYSGFNNNLLEEADRYWGAKLELPKSQ